MSKNLYVIGVDYRTDSVRSVLVNAGNGQEVSSSVFYYPRWKKGLYCKAWENQFWQHPLDYVEELEHTLKDCLRQAGKEIASEVKAISVDTTGSTPVAVDETGTPLSLLPEFKENPNAMFVLWKVHTAIKEAAEINEHALMSKYEHIKQIAYHANMQLPELGLVLFTFGNVSTADRDSGVFAIKPSGIPYRDLTLEKMVIVDFDGNVLEGNPRPSSDTKTHAVLYKHLEGIGGIVHTHSTYATSWAQSQRQIPIYGTTHAGHNTVDISCAPAMTDNMILGDYEYQTGFQIMDCFKEKGLDYHEVEMVLVGNHAPFTWGKTAEKAVYNSAVLESLAEMAFLNEQIKPNAPRLKEPLLRKNYERKHGPDFYYGQEK